MNKSNIKPTDKEQNSEQQSQQASNQFQEQPQFQSRFFSQPQEQYQQHRVQSQQQQVHSQYYYQAQQLAQLLLEPDLLYEELLVRETQEMQQQNEEIEKSLTEQNPSLEYLLALQFKQQLPPKQKIELSKKVNLAKIENSRVDNKLFQFSDEEESKEKNPTLSHKKFYHKKTVGRYEKKNYQIDEDQTLIKFSDDMDEAGDTSGNKEIKKQNMGLKLPTPTRNKMQQQLQINPTLSYKKFHHKKKVGRYKKKNYQIDEDQTLIKFSDDMDEAGDTSGNKEIKKQNMSLKPPMPTGMKIQQQLQKNQSSKFKKKENYDQLTKSNLEQHNFNFEQQQKQLLVELQLQLQQKQLLDELQLQQQQPQQELQNLLQLQQKQKEEQKRLMQQLSEDQF